MDTENNTETPEVETPTTEEETTTDTPAEAVEEADEVETEDGKVAE